MCYVHVRIHSFIFTYSHALVIIYRICIFLFYCKIDFACYKNDLNIYIISEGSAPLCAMGLFTHLGI